MSRGLIQSMKLSENTKPTIVLAVYMTAGPTASTAAGPHTARPAATSTACVRARPNQRVPIQVPATMVSASTSSGIATPDAPRS